MYSVVIAICEDFPFRRRLTGACGRHCHCNRLQEGVFDPPKTGARKTEGPEFEGEIMKSVQNVLNRRKNRRITG